MNESSIKQIIPCIEESAASFVTIVGILVSGILIVWSEIEIKELLLVSMHILEKGLRPVQVILNCLIYRFATSKILF